MASTLVFNDVEGAVRAWLRNQTLVQNAVQGRVWFGIPDGDNPTTPLVVITRVGGSPVAGDARGIEQARLSLSCWGGTKKSAMDAARAVASALVELDNELLDDSVYGYGAEIELGPVWLPDPDGNLQRYVVDALVTVRAA